MQHWIYILTVSLYCSTSVIFSFRVYSVLTTIISQSAWYETISIGEAFLMRSSLPMNAHSSVYCWIQFITYLREIGCFIYSSFIYQQFHFVWIRCFHFSVPFWEKFCSLFGDRKKVDWFGVVKLGCKSWTNSSLGIKYGVSWIIVWTGLSYCC